jgi:hypothetical protein
MRKTFLVLILIFALFTVATHINAQSITSEDDTSWYKTQWGTGIGNCGPTCIAMVIERSGPATSVEQIRAQLPDGATDGATSFDDLLKVLNVYDIHYEWLSSLSDWSGEGILMIAVNPRYIPEVPYEYDGGHYILVTGDTGDNYIINDPLIGSPTRYYSKESIRDARFGYIIWIP